VKGLLGFNSRFGFLLTIIAVLLTACSTLSQAASSSAAVTDRDNAVTGAKSTRGSAKAPAQLIAKTKASSTTVPAGGQRSAVRAAAPGNEYRVAIAALRAGLDRQEQLLAAQQQQIAKLVATVDELKTFLYSGQLGPNTEPRPTCLLISSLAASQRRRNEVTIHAG
jgi:hypothetical protein